MPLVQRVARSQMPTAFSTLKKYLILELRKCLTIVYSQSNSYNAAIKVTFAVRARVQAHFSNNIAFDVYVEKKQGTLSQS